MFIITVFSQIVKTKLKEKGLKQQYLADTLLMDKSAISHLLNRDNISLDKMQAIATALDCRLIIDLVPIDDNKEV